MSETLSTNIRFEMPRSFISIIEQIREKNWPNEACGLIFGHIINEGNPETTCFRATAIRELQSQKKSPGYFEIDPVEQYMVTEEEQARGNAFVGILHTHPGGQFVSGTDAAYMKNADKFFKVCWVIAGDGGDNIDIGVYMVVGTRIVQIPLHYSPDE